MSAVIEIVSIVGGLALVIWLVLVFAGRRAEDSNAILAVAIIRGAASPYNRTPNYELANERLQFLKKTQYAKRHPRLVWELDILVDEIAPSEVEKIDPPLP